MRDQLDGGTAQSTDQSPGLDLVRIGRETLARTDPWQRAVAFGAVPVLILAIGTLPPSLQASLALAIDSPAVQQLLLSNYVHGSVPHLSNNVLSYLVVMTVLFPLAALSGRLRELGIAGIVFCTLGAVLISLYSIETLDGTTVESTLGFSGVAAAFLGVLPVFIGFYLRDNISSTVRPLLLAVSLFGLELGVLLLVVGVLPRSNLALVALGLIGSGLVVRAILRSETSAPFHHRTLVVYALLVFTVAPVGLFIRIDSGVNVYAHLGGFVSGWFLPVVALAVGEVRRLQNSTSRS
jgi:membrane associated rhomboid family serine protease